MNRPVGPPRGMLLPTLLVLAAVLMLVASALVASSTSSLRATTHDQQTDVALYAAETGLARVAEEYVRTRHLAKRYVSETETGESSYIVTAYANDTVEPMRLDNGIIIPPSTLFLLSEGVSPNGTRRRAGALFRSGLGAFQVGLLADSVQARNARFDAYDSTTNTDPTLSRQSDRGILASNRIDPSLPDAQFQLGNTTVDGGVFTAPGTSAAEQIQKTGTTVVAREGTLAEPVLLEQIVVPSLAEGTPRGGVPSEEGEDEEVNLGNYAPAPWQLVKGAPSELTVTYDATTQSLVFADIGEPTPEFRLSVADLRTKNRAGGTFSQNVGSGRVYLNFSNDPPSIGYHDGRVAPSFQATSDVPFPPIITDVLGSGTVSVENPDELEGGEYDNVVIDDDTPTELDDGTYVIKSLRVTGNGQLKLPAGRQATIYVTEHLSAEGPDALVNDTRLPPNLRILYTGREPVSLGGGSQSFFTLVAPQAQVRLIGPNPDSLTSFHGALAGKTLEVENAHFHFDVATEGVGTGTDGSALLLLSRQRL